eukprot:TRINITY_DN4674_c0_g1_i1.p1 TRINITY_DN4674_c0_g1~~TRINITY_DN4674_c0_g1_i1.p1  ORF type:complete len:121 (-),score=41.23 TRINITY_DN4674_c0_g1_i1:244-606(-)
MAEDGSFRWAVQTGDLPNVKNAIEKEGENVNAVSEDINKQTPLHWAADYGQLEVMTYLVSKGANVNAKNNFGITPLLAATYESHTSCVKFLLSKGADKAVKGPDGLTAKEAATGSTAALF